MFRSATVENFQSVDSASVEFPIRESGGSLTTVVGPSSTGKSAFLRALHTLVYNTNSVSARVRAGAKTLKVSALLSDGREVRIQRGASLSTYEIDDETYTKSGTTAPEFIQNLFRMQPDLHIRFQFSPPYLLSDAPAAVAAAFARLTNAHVLREAAREGNRRALRAKQAAEMQGQEAEKISTRLAEEFADLEQHREAVAAIALRVDQMEALESARAAVEGALGQYRTAAAQAGAAEGVLLRFSSLPDVRQRLSEAANGIRRYVETAQTLQALYAAQEAAKFTPSVPDLSSQIEEMRALALAREEVIDLFVVIANRAPLVRALSATEAEVETARTLLAEARAQIKVCPTCGQEVPQ